MAEADTIAILLVLAAIAVAAGLAHFHFRARQRSIGRRRAAPGLETLSEFAPAGIWRADADGQCIMVNHYWEVMAGLRDKAWRGNGWAAALHPDDRDRVFASFLEAVASETRYEGEWRFQRPDGSVLWVKSLGAPEYDEHGKLKGYIGINFDIQRAKDLEADLSRALERSEQAAHAKTAFLANMSHEIRTPMNGVIGFTEMLLDSDLADEQRAQVQMIADSGRAMMLLLNDILDVAKIESGQMRIVEEPIDIRQKLRLCAKLHEPMTRAKGLQLSIFVDEDVPDMLLLDRLRIRQVLLNLVGNAVKFTDEGGIDVEARVENGTDGKVLVIAVIDTGIGIADDKLETIFTPFTQEDGAVARQYGGTGLGLAISSQLVAMMGGRITVQSKRGVGSSFTARLPLRESRESAPGHAAQEMPHGALAQFGNAHVLVAEDHAINQQLILSMLASLGIRARLVDNGEQAIAAVIEADSRGQPFDVVLMDMLMPGIDGLEATRRLRQLGFGARQLPIVALTANCYPEDVAACRQAGMQSHLGKPVTTVTLARELARWLSPTENAGASHLEQVRPAEPNVPAQRPSLDGLAGRYRDRRDRLLLALRSSLRASPGDTDWDGLAGDLHKLAGVAATFGDAELGEASRRLEKGIKSASEPARRHAALRRQWAEFEQALEQAA